MIPVELTKLRQWCVCYPEKKRRAPLNPVTKKAASSTDPNTWGTYEQAINSGLPCIGFVLSKNDPYTIIDLDAPLNDEQRARHNKIVEAANSYTEISVSGTGVHIIAKGSVPRGFRRDQVEVYSDARFMVCTGNVLKNLPVQDEQKLLNILYNEMAEVRPEIDLDESIEATESDNDLFKKAANAVNGDKFKQLCNGQWHDDPLYPSQSEADYALLSMLAFYTRNEEQARRMFRATALGRRPKAQNNAYINRCLKKIRAKQPPLVDISTLVKPLIPEPVPVEVPKPPKKEKPLEYPPGLVGEIAKYVYSSAIRPVKEVGIVSALGLMSGIVGRCYNISGTGLNQYIMLLARTGSGKEGMDSGISSLINACRDTVPVADQFLGPGVFASGQALLKILNSKPSFLSILGEVGITLQQMCDKRANAADKMLKRVLLDLYGKSGRNKWLQPMVYSDATKNTNAVVSPNVTIVGESTQDQFYDNIDISHVAEGLIPRFSIVEYTGKRSAKNKNAFHAPHKALIDELKNLILISLSAQQSNHVTDVKISEEALILLDDFDKHADSTMNDNMNEIDLQLWNRADLKALKIAAVLAVGQNPENPLVSENDAQWAIDFVKLEIGTVLKRFKAGNVGIGDNRAMYDIMRLVEEYIHKPYLNRINYRVSDAIAKAHNVIPYSYLRKRAARLTTFNRAKLGTMATLSNTIEDLVRSGNLIKMPPQTAWDKYKTTSQLLILKEL
jgi:hypothetical protein